MIFSDFKLRQLIGSKRLLIDPLKDDTVQQNGVDLRVADEIASRVPNSTELMDASSSDSIAKFFKVEKSEKGFFVLRSSHHYLFSTQESIKLPTNIMGFCGLRSTFARLGFVSPLTIVDAGFEGTLTIGVFYGGSSPIRIPVGCRFLHLVFAKMADKVDKPYQGHYQNQRGIKLPRAVV